MMLRGNKILAIALFFAATSVAGCGSHAGSFDVDDSTGTKWDNLVAMVTFKDKPPQPRPMDAVQCPEIVILNATGAERVYKTGSDTNDSLRHQFSISDVARDCRVENGQMAMKVGVQGNVLLGPAGGPGNYAASIRLVIVRELDQAVVVSKLYHVPATVAAGQTQGPFTLVTEPLSIAYSNTVHDYTVKVGFDSSFDKKKDKSAPAQVQQANAQTSDDKPRRHHRRPAQTQQ
jgi:hypothetical protein